MLFGVSSLAISAFATFMLFFGLDINAPVTLDKCIVPISPAWYIIFPSYSGIISILFFGRFLQGI